MPALPAGLLHDLEHTAHALARSLDASNDSSSANDGFEVVCAWPVSGQYGPGSRVLYYVLVVVCIFARKTKWLRNGCLAAALLFPAVAAMHSIVLAAIHVNGAVDMDIFGAFQLCTIGALAGPVTVRLSDTYFSQPGRNAIFVWSSFVLAGLLSLTIEFYRSSGHKCSFPASSTTVHSFNYGIEKCGLICSTEEGPRSPIRGGSADNIDVIPTPHKLSFDAGMLVAAACCIPAVLLLIGMWIKIKETDTPRTAEMEERSDASEGCSLESLSGRRDQESQDGRPPSTKQKPNKIMARLQNFLEIPVFGSAILAIVIVGEENLFSPELKFDSEPMSNVGQWAPIAGIALALFGSLYLLLAEAVARLSPKPPNQIPSDGQEPTSQENPKPHINLMGNSHDNIELIDKIARWWIAFWRDVRIGSPAPETNFRREAAGIYPSIPGEGGRNASLERVETQWTARRSTAGSVRSGISGHGCMEERSPVRDVGEEKLQRKATLEVPVSPVMPKPVLTFEPDEIEPCPSDGPPSPTPVRPGIPGSPGSQGSHHERRPRVQRTRGPSIVIQRSGDV